VRRALDLGINLIDTAAGYGRSEELLGVALADVPRDSYVLSTKFWPVNDGALRPPDELRDSFDESLRRLRLDHVDIFYLHGVGPDWYRPCLETYGELLGRLRQAGRARYLGVSEQYSQDHAHRMVSAAARDGVFDVAMVGYNLVSPAAALQALPDAQAHDLGVVIMCAVRKVIAHPDLLGATIRAWKAEGLLAPDAVPNDAPLDWLLGPGIASLTDAAYKFATDHPAVGSVLTGTANPEHLEANVWAALGDPLPPEKRQRILELFGPVGRNVQAGG
jgi:L-galactose dehydrogenase